MASSAVTAWAALAAAAMATAAAASPAVPLHARMQSGALVLASGGSTLDVSLKCPRFRLEGAAEVGGALSSEVRGDIHSGGPVEASFPPIPVADSAALEVRLLLRWSPSESVLRKWVRFRLRADAPKVLQELVLEDLGAAGRAIRTDPSGLHSQPAFLDGFFLGIEFPVAATRLEGGRLLLASRPGLRMQPNAWYESRRAVYGVAPKGEEESAFRRYILVHRPAPRGLHLDYNTWWTSPVPYTERDLLDLMRVFEENLYRRHQVSFDTFTIDMGWSDPRSLWQIDRAHFPHEFAGIQQGAARMKCRLGLWISPSSCYPGALDNEWAAQRGYENFVIPWGGQPTRFLCLGGRRYREALQGRLVEMIRRYGVRAVKLDGYLFECPESDHGHEPGALSPEAIADGIIQVLQACRRAAPDVWLEATCFGWNASPWWLFYVNSLIGVYGDDAPYGRVPAPVYREAYTTARDFFNLQGANWLPTPITAQEVLGIVHQAQEPFLNDAVMTVMRGHGFLPVYLNPEFMNDSRWRALAGVLKWARANAPLLQQTEPLLPESWRGGRCPRFTGEAAMPREPYGYAHWNGRRALVALRNPWIVPQTFPLPLRLAAGTSNCQAVSLYPEARLYGKGLRAGDTLQVPLAPYETLVLSIGPGQPTAGLTDAPAAVLGKIKAAVSKHEVAGVEFEGDEKGLGPDYTCPLGEAASAVALRLEAQVAVVAPQAELLVLLEGGPDLPSPLCRLRVSGQPVEMSATGSDTGWASTVAAQPEHWLFLRAPLASGQSDLALEVLAGNPLPKISVWVSASRPGRPGAAGPNALPEPELLSLDAVPLLAPMDTGAAGLPVERMARPLERIDGIFLDTLEPISAASGWGTVQKNRSVWGKPITMGGRRYLRGIGTHAPSRIVFALDGKYRRFQSWAGADQATNPTVTFEVWVDGEKRWASGLMKRNDAPARVDLDVTGAKTLELRVGDGGNGIVSDHADWADARLLR